MINETDILHTQRVVFVVDALCDKVINIELAVDLAAAMQSQLQGLFIEDIDLFNIASLPCSREICLTTGEPRTLSIQQLQKRLNSMADQFRQLLAQKAEQSVVQWSYTTVRGRKQDLPLGDYSDADYLILEQSAKHLHHSTHQSQTKRILLVEDHSPNLYPALEVVSRKLSTANLELFITRASRASLMSEQENIWRTAGGLSQRRHISIVNPDQVEQLLINRADFFDYVLIARTTETTLLKNIIKWSQCPVIVVGDNKASPAH
ncbi:MAG: hypothetical protein H6995_08605 [Pseudomonadales bacterium]|nr:hypothetical protein [Pseudomonadales bacterium]MCP5215056.1 hypothetical protein [Pseudomonadales bacterium]